MSDPVTSAPAGQLPANQPLGDQLLPETCAAIATVARQLLEAEPRQWTAPLRLPGGPEVGRQITIDATEKGGMLNQCRVAVLEPTLAPAGEVVRIEFEHDKQGKFGPLRVYSIQSLRQRGSGLVLLENFLAASPREVREEDFRSIQSEAYARTTVLTTLQEWAHFRAWQLQQLSKEKGK